MLTVNNNGQSFDSMDNYRIDERRDFSVTQGNELIQRSKYKLDKGQGKSPNIMERRILMYLISRIKPDDKELHAQTFDINEFCEVCGLSLSGGYYYTSLKKAIENLASKVMWLYDDNEETFTLVRWLEKAVINTKSATIQIKLDKDLAPYLLQLHSNYTQYSLSSVIRMSSKYGMLLYEKLKSYYYRGQRIKFAVDTLKELLDCTNYKVNSDFRKRALEPALADINTYSDLYVEMSYERKGREIKYIVFYMRDLRESDNEADLKEFYRRQNNVAKDLNPKSISLMDIDSQEYPEDEIADNVIEITSPVIVED